MKSDIWRLAGISLLCLSVSAQVLADDQNQHDQNWRGQNGNGNGGEHREQNQNQNRPNAAQQQQFQQQRQQQIQQQQNQQQQIQQQCFQQQQQNQQERFQQQQQRQQQQVQQQTQQRELQQRQNSLPIQGHPNEVWQTQQPRQGFYNDNGNRRWQAGGGGPHPGDVRWAGRPDGHGNGWGPGPQYRPGYVINSVPGGYSRVPYRGQDYFYSGGYWYRPQGPHYVVVTPPYGVRVRSLPSYSSEVWIGSSLFFVAAGTYYVYQQDTQDYVVTSPPPDAPPVYTQAPPQPPQDNGYDPVAYPANGQTPEQVQQDRYECYRWAVGETGFDPANVTSQPPAELVDLYRRSMGACLAGRGYSVN